MKRTSLIRLGGLAAMVGGVALFTLSLMTWLCIPNCPRSLAYITSALFVLLAFGAMAAIAVLHIIQRERYGLLGTLAFLVAFVGVAMIFVGELRSLVIGVSQGSPGAAAFPWLFIIGLLVATVGIIAYGAVTIGAGMLPWWCGVALIAGSPLVGLFLYLFSPVEGLLLGVPWVVVGFAVFRAATRQTERSSRVR
jgi:drug/metabolite transporter (DMT)-like permease